MGNLFLIADRELDVGTFGESNGFCDQSADIWQVVGYVLLVFKIVIPIILIIFGMIDLGRSVVSGKDDEIKSNMKSLMIRAIAAIAIFFIPTLIGIIMSVVSSFGTIKEDFKICKECIANPTGETCKQTVEDIGGGAAAKKK